MGNCVYDYNHYDILNKWRKIYGAKSERNDFEFANTQFCLQIRAEKDCYVFRVETNSQKHMARNSCGHSTFVLIFTPLNIDSTRIDRAYEHTYTVTHIHNDNAQHTCTEHTHTMHAIRNGRTTTGASQRRIKIQKYDVIVGAAVRTYVAARPKYQPN